MGTWNSRGLRGSTLEDMINHTNDLYREKKLALIQKIPTPITPVSIDKTSRHITLAYFEQNRTQHCVGTSLRFCLLDRQPAEVLRRREYQSANPTGESWETDCSGLSEGHEKS